jgi:hypothetical protein
MLQAMERFLADDLCIEKKLMRKQTTLFGYLCKFHNYLQNNFQIQFIMTTKRKKVTGLAKRFALLLVLIPFCLNAQQRNGNDRQNGEISTLFGGNRPAHIGFYAAPEVKLSQVRDHNRDSQFATFVGGRAGVIFNRTFSLGLAGYVLTELPRKIIFACPVEAHAGAGRGYLEGGYGGLFLEYINSSMRAVHFTVNTLVGFGGLEIDHERDHERFDHNFRAGFVVEPGVSAVFYITRMFRIAAGVSYRYAPGFRFDFDDRSTNTFNGFSANLSFKVGIF